MTNINWDALRAKYPTLQPNIDRAIAAEGRCRALLEQLDLKREPDTGDLFTRTLLDTICPPDAIDAQVQVAK